MLNFTTGNMFDINAGILVNTVNCVGVMGCGVALEFKKRYPDMFKVYRSQCRNHEIYPGGVYINRVKDGKLVLNFATKDHWRCPSRYAHIENGLIVLRKILSITEDGPVVAIPALGCGHGGLCWDVVKEMIKERLYDIDHLNIHVFQPNDSRQLGNK